MKKLIFSVVLMAALVCSTSAMAQDVKKSEPAKAKVETKAIKSEAKAVKTEAAAAKADVKKESKKLTPAKAEQPVKQATTNKAK